MNFTLTNVPSYVETTTNVNSAYDAEDVVRPVFTEQDGTYTVILGDLMSDWGEGDTPLEAVHDLVAHLSSVHGMLHEEPDAKLAEHLRYQRDFLCALYDR